MSVQVDILFEEHLKYNRVAGEICATDPNLKEVFSDLLKVMVRHEKMEEDLVFPLYRDLINRLSNSGGSLDDELEEKFDIFMRTRSRLIEDHNVFRRVLQDAPGRIYRVELLTAFDEMLHHIRFEEELLYPSIAVLWKAVIENSAHKFNAGVFTRLV